MGRSIPSGLRVAASTSLNSKTVSQGEVTVSTTQPVPQAMVSAISSPVFAPPWTDSARYAPQPLISHLHYLLSPSQSLSMIIMRQDHHNRILQRSPVHHSTSQHLTAPLASLPAPPQPQQPPHFTSPPFTASHPQLPPLRSH
ncbi:hypothetical protein P692DRAFT_20883139 [Suillus brevipes Sb2]|nr:hypothetical protein P692DRAFT_20883139 [Suillus brevipes Sb2]